jgi:hypothetical protein
MVCPCVPLVLLATLVTCRSALVGRLIVLVAVLLAVLGSAVVLVILTALVMLPLPLETCTVRVMVPPPPLARLAWVTVSAVPVVCRVPTLLVALTRVRPVSASVRVMLAAALGPALAKVMT